MSDFQARKGRLPLVYHEDYNVWMMGLEKLHPFDTAKFDKVVRYLMEKAGLKIEDFYRPSAVFYDHLGQIHSEEYLDSLSFPSHVAAIAEFSPLATLPANTLQRQLLYPMRLATGGTILAVQLALEFGWSINLGGGFHHAKPGNGEGFCFFADIPLAIHYLRQQQPDVRILVIDTDAHQGNGLATFLAQDPKSFLLDFYNSEIYPNDQEAEAAIDYAYPLAAGTGDDLFLDTLIKGLNEAIEDCRPGLILYNSGTDIFIEDLLGGFRVSDRGIFLRDRWVFEAAFEREIPIAMVTAGGYSPHSGELIGKSIAKLLRHLPLRKMAGISD